MYGFLFEGTQQFYISSWILGAMTFTCLLILLFTIHSHLRTNRIARRMTDKEAIYTALVQSVRLGLAKDTDIRDTIPPRDYPYFERFLQKNISSVQDIDVSAEKEIAEACGFIDHLKKRIIKSRKMKKTIAIRVLSYFRDKGNITLFRKIQVEESFPPAVYAASMGIALCKDPKTFFTKNYRLWNLSGRNLDAFLVLFSIQGETIAPVVYRLLSEELLKDDAKILITKYLGEINYREAIGKITEMLTTETSFQVLASCLYALGYIGNESVVDKIVPFLEHPDFNLRIKALHAAAKANGTASIEHLKKRLEDTNWWVRREAALALAGMGKEGIECLRKAAEEGCSNAGSSAQGILAELQFNRITV